MKTRLSLLVLLSALSLSIALPASAQVLYNNGPVNGETDAWVINFGFVTSDTFTLSQQSQITGVAFNNWIFPGDVVESVDVDITSQVNGGTTYFNQQINLTQSGCFSNEFGFNVCQENGSFNGPTLGAGTYWLNLQNAVINDGDPVYWDENSGVGCTSPGCPSQASSSDSGTIPSESFTILGTSSGTGSVPEPASIVLFASGVLGFGGMLRRKLR